MKEPFTLGAAGRGRISSGPTVNLIASTLQFVHSELARWRDDADRVPEQAEERLNIQLSKYLNVAARDHFPMVHFHHEEKQTGTRRVDLSAVPQQAVFVGQTYHSIYDPLLVFEGKRLPSPTATREREYVSGGAARTGGIQRFKLGLHGAQHETAAIIGYIQARDLFTWFSEINLWISELAISGTDDEEQWNPDEQLTDFVVDANVRVSLSWSAHQRFAKVILPKIKICHLWVVM